MKNILLTTLIVVVLWISPLLSCGLYIAYHMNANNTTYKAQTHNTENLEFLLFPPTMCWAKPKTSDKWYMAIQKSDGTWCLFPSSLVPCKKEAYKHGR